MASNNNNSSNKNPKKANLLDHHSIKHILDEYVSEIVTSRGYVEDVRMSNVRLLMGSIIIIIALVAQFYPKKFPENRDFLIVCILLYPFCCVVCLILIFFCCSRLCLVPDNLRENMGKETRKEKWEKRKRTKHSLSVWELDSGNDIPKHLSGKISVCRQKAMKLVPDIGMGDFSIPRLMDPIYAFLEKGVGVVQRWWRIVKHRKRDTRKKIRRGVRNLALDSIVFQWLEPDITGLVVSSKLPRFSDLYTLSIASADPKSKAAKDPVEFTKSVTQWFTTDGILVEGLFWKDVEGLINDYAREPKKNK
ncbi:putative signal peptidase complex subunit 2 [Vitis vinifera]|uniref:Signal peptidase complex subunit 2 n=1 Tax=Vitis vinifera TaxID=29760 RepID=A0A438E0T9_VITVI|nr:putative signal peptidase complex subunit 2 [Vitis vinifera]